MYIESEEVMSQLALAIDDIKGVWPNMALLPRVSSLWKRNEELADREINKNVYEVVFGDGFLRVYELDGDIQICLENKD